MRPGVVRIGEGFAGVGIDLAHVNTVVGERAGPAGIAFATALATPTTGHTPFLVVLQPGLTVQPPTLFVNKATIDNARHGELTWGAAQAGVAAGVADALVASVLDPDSVGDQVVIAAVWVNPRASDDGAVYANNRAATLAALIAGHEGAPDVARVLDARDVAWNPYFRAGCHPDPGAGNG